MSNFGQEIKFDPNNSSLGDLELHVLVHVNVTATVVKSNAFDCID